MYPTKPLWEICDLHQPKTISTKEMIEDWKYPVFWANWIIWKYDKYNHKDKEILITCRWATYWTINISEEFSWINWNAMVAHIKNPKEVNFYFLFYFLKNLDFSKIISGSAQPQITRWWLVNVLVSLPLEESTQQKIVSKLDNLFENIDKNISLTKQNIANIDEENNAILEKIFKECEEEFGSEKIEKILDKNFSIWKIPVKEYLKEWVLPIIDQWKNFIWWYTNDNSQKYSWKLPVLVYWDHTNSVKFIDFDFTWWADWIKIFKFWEKIDTKYMFYVINYYKPENLWYRRHFPILKQIKIPLPPLPTQQKIVEKLDKIFSANSELKNFYEKNLKNLEELKQSILKQAFEDENFIK